MKNTLLEKIKHHLHVIYPDTDLEILAQEVYDAFWQNDCNDFPAPPRAPYDAPWNEASNVLITYADSIQDKQHPHKKKLPLLQQFLKDNLSNVIETVHLLPFFPYTSDDGFAVQDYEQVRDDIGTWDGVKNLARDYRIMSDIVINHASASNPWFTKFLNGNPDFDNFFMEGNPDDDLSAVVRPRATPLLTAFDTPTGIKNIWCTFGADQVDFDFSNTKVLLTFIKLIRFYLDQNIRIFRLDAVGFLWKDIGTNCMHLPQTHEIIRLIRALTDHYKDPVIIITETNVPNHENLTYFGNQNEAHMIYNFSLPPLLVHALLSGKRRYLKKWLMAMPPAQDGCTYFNFTASHDGIGLRPSTGLLSDKHRNEMMDTIKKFGGQISMRKDADGTETPYEMNISLFDALKGTIKNGEDDYQMDRFIASQTIMMALEGVPAFYIHSLLATPNDHDRFNGTKHNRHLNRHQWDVENLKQKLADKTSHQSITLKELKRLIGIRSSQPCFHPNAIQFVLQLDEGLFGIWRQSLDRKQNTFCITNIWDKENTLPLSELNLYAGTQWHDLLSNAHYDDWNEDITLKPYQTVWITNKW